MKKLYISLFLLLLASCSENNRPQEIWIKNADNESIYLQLSGNKDTDSPHLAIIQHGLASNMEHPAVQTAKQAFLDKGYLVITFDSRHSLGKSDGKVINVRLETFENDLETVINWAKNKNFTVNRLLWPDILWAEHLSCNMPPDTLPALTVSFR